MSLKHYRNILANASSPLLVFSLFLSIKLILLLKMTNDSSSLSHDCVPRLTRETKERWRKRMRKNEKKKRKKKKMKRRKGRGGGNSCCRRCCVVIVVRNRRRKSSFFFTILPCIILCVLMRTKTSLSRASCILCHLCFVVVVVAVCRYAVTVTVCLQKVVLPAKILSLSFSVKRVVG